MITQGTLALLSACKCLFNGMDLAIARNVKEIQTIARHVLRLVPETSEGQLCARGEGFRSPQLQSSDIDAAFLLPDSFIDLGGGATLRI